MRKVPLQVIGVVVLIILGCLDPNAAVRPAAVEYCVRPGARGAADGSDWENAWTEIPETLERGAVYYLADGTYADCTLDDPEAGVQRITIRKATPEDHGTDRGWSDSYGDGRAIFGSMCVRSGYWTIDGSRRTSKDSGHGIKLEVSIDPDPGVSDNHGIVVNAGTGVRVDGIRIEYVEFEGVFGAYPSGDSAPTVNGYEHTNGGDDLYVGYCYFHHFMGPMQRTRGQNRAVYEHNYYRDNRSYPDGPHGDAIQLWNSENSVIRFNEFQDIEGTAVINLAWDVENIRIYGNTCSYTSDYDEGGVGNGIASPYDGDVGALYVYNNTMANSPTKMYFSMTGDRVGTDHYCVNNIWFKCFRESNAAGVDTEEFTHHGHNFVSRSSLLWTYEPADTTKLTTTDPFVDSAGYDFHLAGPTGPGLDLSTQTWWDPRYDSARDPDGTIRGQDGSWDVGAYEYP